MIKVIIRLLNVVILFLLFSEDSSAINDSILQKIENGSFRTVSSLLNNKGSELESIRTRKNNTSQLISNLRQKLIDFENDKINNQKRSNELAINNNKAEQDIKRLKEINISYPKEKRLPNEKKIVELSAQIDNNNNELSTIQMSQLMSDSLKSDFELQLKNTEQTYQELIGKELDNLAIIDVCDEAINNMDPVSKQQSRDWFMTLGAISTILIFMILYFCTMRFFVKNNKSDIVSEIMLDNEGVKFVSVFVIIIVIVLFGSMRIIDGNAISGLLGSISGYLLGRIGKEKSIVGGKNEKV